MEISRGSLHGMTRCAKRGEPRAAKEAAARALSNSFTPEEHHRCTDMRDEQYTGSQPRIQWQFCLGDVWGEARYGSAFSTSKAGAVVGIMRPSGRRAGGGRRGGRLMQASGRRAGICGGRN